MIEAAMIEQLVRDLLRREGFPQDATVDRSSVFTENEVIRACHPQSSFDLLICVDESITEGTVALLQAAFDDDVLLVRKGALTERQQLVLSNTIHLRLF